MRGLILLPAAALASCGGGDTRNKAAPAASISPGQYEVTAEVTRFEPADSGAPKINTPVGTKTTRSVCAGAALNPDLFADQGLACQAAGSPYVRNGAINVSISCTRPDLQGPIGADVSGRFDAASFDVTRKLATALATDGDVRIETHLTARRTGDCQAAPAPAAAAPARR